MHSNLLCYKYLTVHGNVKLPGYVKCIEWLSRQWDTLNADLITKSFSVCGIKSHAIEAGGLIVDTASLHRVLDQMIRDKIEIANFVDDDQELNEANDMMNEASEDIYDRVVSPDIAPDDDEMTSEETIILARLENETASYDQPITTSRPSLMNLTNTLKLVQIRLPVQTPVVCQPTNRLQRFSLTAS